MNKVVYDSSWPLDKKKVKIPTGEIIEGYEEWYYFYPENDVEQAIKEVKEELKELTRIVYGNSPDTINLNGYKGLIKNQLYILEKKIDNKIFGEGLTQ